MSTILAIETSCDETGVAVLTREGNPIVVKSQALASQADVHALTGGVVPEVAAREHVTVIRPLIEQVLSESKYTPDKLDGIAVTVGPGLMPALSVGVTTARTLSYAWDLPLIPVNHLEGHIYSALLQQRGEIQSQSAGRRTKIQNSFTIPGDSEAFPALALIVSGGHTLFVNVTSHLQYDVVGTTVDDAAGEAFDKVARLLGLPYPGGPKVAALAKAGDPAAYDFPRPMLDSGDLNVSFSGLKTAVRYAVAKRELTEKDKADVAASFQEAVVATLATKTKQALGQSQPKLLLLTGGVAANESLRTAIRRVADATDIQLAISPRELCGDNAVMIGQVGLFALEAKRTTSWRDIDAVARLAL